MAPMLVLSIATVIAFAEPKQLVAGTSHVCALEDNGDVFCWGDNRMGQLGRGTFLPDAGAERVPFDSPILAIDAVGDSTCAVDRFHRTWCWGSNARELFSENARDHRASPELVRGLGPLRALSLGDGVGCGIADDAQELWCWGKSATKRGPASVAAGVCAVLPDGRLRCTEKAPIPVPIPRGAETGKMVSGEGFSCAAAPQGVYCWGDNTWDQLGVSSALLRFEPVDLSLEKVVDIVAGDNHNCALVKKGSVYCWGANDAKQIDGTGKDVFAPTLVEGITGAVELAASGSRTCARTRLRGVWCWGRGAAPEQVLDSASAIGSGCGVVRGQVQCWNKLPDPAFSEVKDVAVATGWGCALRSSGRVSCFDAKGTREIPVEGLVGIALGDTQGVGWTSTGEVSTWGRDASVGIERSSESFVEVTPSASRWCGRRADGTVRCRDLLVPGVDLDVPGLSNTAQLAAGRNHLCARTTSGTVQCLLGNRRGQLGTAPLESGIARSEQAVLVPGLP